MVQLTKKEVEFSVIIATPTTGPGAAIKRVWSKGDKSPHKNTYVAYSSCTDLKKSFLLKERATSHS